MNRSVLLAAALVAMPALAEVSVSDAWVRGTVAGQRATGAFMRILATENASLVAAASPVAPTVEIHEMTMEGGIMKMRAVPRVPLPKGQPVELKPGGYHIMLMGLATPVGDGKVPITLTFEHADGKRSTVSVQADVRPLGAQPQRH